MVSEKANDSFFEEGETVRDTVKALLLDQSYDSASLLAYLLKIHQSKNSTNEQHCKFCKNNHEDDIFHEFKVGNLAVCLQI